MSAEGKGCAVGCGAAVLVGVAALIGIYALGLSLTHAIFPGSNGAVRSASLEGYDIYFRTNLGMVGDVMAQPAEWHLRVPRAFIRNELGDNGALNDAHSNPGKDYLVGLDAIVDRDSGRLSKLPLFGKPDIDKEFIVDLANSTVGRLDDPNVSKDRCITDDEYFHYPSCNKDIFCNVESSFKEWKVKIFVRPVLYNGGRAAIENICAKTRKILSDYTISVDDLSEERH